MTPKPYKPGFRSCRSDAFINIAGLLLTWISWKFLGSFALIFLIVLFHFFLFCNVFRVRRRYELIWAAVFIANVLTWSQLVIWNWWYILAAQAPFMLGIVLLEICSESYHGIGSGLKNPNAIRSA